MSANNHLCYPQLAGTIQLSGWRAAETADSLLLRLMMVILQCRHGKSASSFLPDFRQKIAGYLFRFPAWVCRWWSAGYLVFDGLSVRQMGILLFHFCLALSTFKTVGQRFFFDTVLYFAFATMLWFSLISIQAASTRFFMVTVFIANLAIHSAWGKHTYIHFSFDIFIVARPFSATSEFLLCYSPTNLNLKSKPHFHLKLF